MSAVPKRLITKVLSVQEIGNYLDRPRRDVQNRSAACRGDEAESFLFVVPLDDSGMHFGHACYIVAVSACAVQRRNICWNYPFRGNRAREMDSFASILVHGGACKVVTVGLDVSFR
jgi:hypothetical protein